MNKNILLLICRSFIKGTALILLEIVVNSIFLTTIDLHKLPLVYIGISIVTIISGVVFTYLDQKTAIHKLLLYSLIILTFLVGISSIILIIHQNQTIVILLMIIKSFFWILINIEFWTVAGTVIDIRAGKKYFGIIASGEIGAFIIWGTILGLMKGGNTNTLLILVIISVFLYLVTYIYIIKINKDKFNTNIQVIKNNINPFKGVIKLFKNNFILIYYITAAISSFAFYLIDYLFMFNADRLFSNAETLRSFFSIFFVILGLANLAGTLLLSGRMMVRFGIKIVVLILPVSTLFFATGSMLSAILSIGIVCFIFAALTKAGDDFNRQVFEYPSQKVIAQTVSKEDRLKILTIQETFVEPLIIGLTGIILLLLSELTIIIPVILCLTAIGWVVSALLMRNRYKSFLLSAYKNNKIDPFSITEIEPSIISAIEKGLTSELADRAVYSLRIAASIFTNNNISLITGSGYDSTTKEIWFKNILLNSLNHGAEDTITTAINTISQHKLEGFIDDIRKIISKYINKETTVLSSAFFLLSEHCELHEELFDFAVKCENTSALTGILAGLFCNSETDSIDRVISLLSATYNKSAGATLKTIEMIVGKSHYNSSLDDLLISLIQSDNDYIAKEALRIGCIAGLQFIIDNFLDILNIKGRRKTLIINSSRFDQRLYPICVSLFEKNFIKTGILENEISAAKLIKYLPQDLSFKTTQTVLNEIQFLTRNILLKSLADSDITPDFMMTDYFKQVIAIEIKEASFKFRFSQKLIDMPNAANAITGLTGEMRVHKINIFKLLSIIFDKNIIKKIENNYFFRFSDKKALAVESLDNLIKAPYKKTLIDLLEDKPELDPTLSELTINDLFDILTKDFKISDWTNKTLNALLRG